MNNSIGIRGLSDDWRACRKALEAGNTVWLLEKGRPHVSRAQAFRDANGFRYELLKGAGRPITIAHLVDGSTQIPIGKSNMTEYAMPDLDRLMPQIETAYAGWTTHRSLLDEAAAYSWDYIDYDAWRGRN